MKKVLLLLLCLPSIMNAQQLTNNTSINITKSWSQQANGFTYPLDISVPTSNAPKNGFPICILLHGNGGNGIQIINQFSNIIECHVLVAPTGYMNSWNICAENSNGPDIEMINDLVDSLQLYSNINPNKIRILGFSNGAGLANSIFIENTNSGLDIVCAIVSQLNEPQYHAGNFYEIGSNTDSSSQYCGYNFVTNPLPNRKYLSISNDNDPVIPYFGGYSMVGLNFLHAEDAAYIIAQNQGYDGNIITGTGMPFGNPVVFKYSYLSDNVVHVRGNAQHSINASQEEYIKSFLNDCSNVTNINNIYTKNIKVYPNPSNNIYHIEFNSDSETEILVTNTLGEQVYIESTKSIGEFNTKIDLSNYSKGIYNLTIKNSDEISNHKLILH